jgi:hypothetical protein
MGKKEMIHISKLKSDTNIFIHIRQIIIHINDFIVQFILFNIIILFMLLNKLLFILMIFKLNNKSIVQ